MDVSENSGTQQPWVFLLKMIILGCFGGTLIFGNTHIDQIFFCRRLVQPGFSHGVFADPVTCP